MIFKKKINLVNTTSSKELPLGLSHKLISRAHCEMFWSIFCMTYMTFVLKYWWFLHQLFALRNSIPMRSASKPVNKPKARAAIPWENELKVCPKWSASSSHKQSETWIPPRARICVAPAYLRVYNVAGWIFPVFLLMIIRVIGDRKFFIIMSEKLMWLNSLWFDGWGW